MKTGGSAFEKFHRDENTTLVEVADRIVCTSITLDYTIPLPPNIPLTIDNLKQISDEIDFAKIATTVKETVLDEFTVDCASVQATQYNALQTILKKCKEVESASMVLPNKHYM
jgi:urate oxidase